MKHRSLIMALGVSLLFNIFVLLGFVQARAQREAPPGRHEGSPLPRLRDDLNLSEAQAGLYGDLAREMRAHRTTLDEDMALIRQELFTELRKPAPDLEQLKALVARQSEVEREWRLAGTELFGRFMGSLDVPQRRALFARLAAGPLGKPPPPSVQRFDRNGDGVMDPAEIEDARRAFGARGFGDFHRPRRHPDAVRPDPSRPDSLRDEARPHEP